MDKLKASIKRILDDPLKLRQYEDETISGRRRQDGRLTYWVNSGYKTPAEVSEKVFWWMFGEDIHNRIMPYPRGEARVSVCPEDNDIQQVLFKGMDASTSGHGFDLQDVTEDFIRTTTQIIYSYGEAYYEIVYPKTTDDAEEAFRLELIYTPSMVKVFGWYFQVITPAAAKHASIRMGITKIPKDRILHITSPDTLGGHLGLKKIMNGLLSHRSGVVPKFVLQAMKTMENNENIGFDTDEWDLNRYIYRARLTKKFGWSQRRELSDAPILEYYWITRILRQAKAMIVIRQHIIDELNNTLAREVLFDGHKIVVKGPHTLRSVEDTEQSLQKGDVTFNDIVKKFI